MKHHAVTRRIVLARFFSMTLFFMLPLIVHASSPVDLHLAMRSEIRALPAPDMEGEGEFESKKAPNPRNALLMSALVPGLGQLYVSGWTFKPYSAARTAAYLAFEGFGWYQYTDYRKKGWDQEDEYRAYADEHWVWKEDPCAYPNEYRGALPEPPDLSTEALRLEFYEDIHKLPKWICGWEDYPDEAYLRPDEGVLIEETPMRLYYRGLRREQNDLLTTARHWLLAIIVNHGVSAFDAWFTARRMNEPDQPQSDGLSIDFGKPATGVGGTIGLAWKF